MTVYNSKKIELENWDLKDSVFEFDVDILPYFLRRNVGVIHLKKVSAFGKTISYQFAANVVAVFGPFSFFKQNAQHDSYDLPIVIRPRQFVQAKADRSGVFVWSHFYFQVCDDHLAFIRTAIFVILEVF